MMGIMQVAIEALEHGAKQSQTVTWTAVAMAFISNVGTWLMILKRNSKKVTPNPGPASKPENSPWPEIRRHGETLVRHDTEIKGIVKGMDENRVENHEEHASLLAAINSLRPGK